jgi:universal stress protein A
MVNLRTIRRLLLGSTSEKVVRLRRQPVLSVGAPSKALDGPISKFNRILCAIDFSECSLAALKYALSLAEGGNARVTALNVIEFMPVGHHPLVGSSFDPYAYRVAVEGINRERLHSVLLEAAPANQKVQGIVTTGKPQHEILRTAHEMQADVIVLGVHGRYPIDRALLGATAEPVWRRANCPVLTVRADGAVSAEA